MSSILKDKISVDWVIPTDLIRINCLGKGEWFLKEKIPSNYCKPTPIPTPKDGNADKINRILETGASTAR